MQVKIPADSVSLEGMLVVPENARGIVLFAHGSGSGRLSPRNNFVAEVLQKKGIGTLLFDLLTEKEDEIYRTRFNIDLLTERLETATGWLLKQPEAKNLSLGYFGASTGAAAALAAAAKPGKKISAVVSRGGRPDLADKSLPKVTAPTLLIVGGNDDVVIELNQKAFDLLKSVKVKELKIVPGATHLFEEPGTLEQVADLAADWFKKHLQSR
ncbi:dienelactone hydrolase family protein [Patescibacteria group bacterium]|nr:dienelactone hydrolase family protein [Patescibacteria group bacterium]MBU1703341.1 dienelactone hydrolase family protein [Patescibacteria group bacterium]MBU1953377.1 dienelactone hydrolase family protein [Patescibacteria group bacterium]